MSVPLEPLLQKITLGRRRAECSERGWLNLDILPALKDGDSYRA